MEYIQSGEKSFLKFDNLSEAGVFHFTSTKSGWGKDGLARFTGDHPEEYQSFRKELAASLKLNEKQFLFPRQVHGTHVEVIDGPFDSSAIPDTDAVITTQPDICICVQTADCVPILIYDPVQNVAGVVHSGWRGTVNKLVSKTIHKMEISFDSLPEDLLVGIGPSIHMHVYEVGSEVINPVREKFANYKHLLKPSPKKGKAYFDLWEANKTLLVNTGVLIENIEYMGFCSYSHDALFYSARRDGAETGRMVTGIMLSA